MTKQVKRSLKDFEGFTNCWGCGVDNPIGLKLKFKREGDIARAEFTPNENHQGWPGYIHGGIINALLDEAVAYPAYFAGYYCVTAKMEARFKKSAAPGQRLLITSRISTMRDKVLEADADVKLEDGTLIAQGKATLFIMEKA
jgi:uncharacterized protein (TIGR00369 family)